MVIQHALKSNRIVLLLANINNDIVFSFEFLINFFLTVKESAATFEISLSDPEKHGDGMNAYVTYAIKTRVRRHIMLLSGRIDTTDLIASTKRYYLLIYDIYSNILKRDF